MVLYTKLAIEESRSIAHEFIKYYNATFICICFLFKMIARILVNIEVNERNTLI